MALGGMIPDPPSPAQPPIDPYSGMPTRPDLASLIDPKTGQLKSQFTINPQENANQASNQGGFQSAWAGLSPNTQALEMYRQQATATGPSVWANLANQQQGQQQQQQANDATQQNASGQAAARSNLAMTGGLSSGARERLALSGANAGNATQQQIEAQGNQARTGISMQDAANKQAMLANLPGMENQALAPGMQKASAWQNLAQNEASQNQQNQQFNVANNMNAQNANVGQTAAQLGAQNQNNLNAYNQQMSGWAAGKQADATANSGKK